MQVTLGYQKSSPQGNEKVITPRAKTLHSFIRQTSREERQHPRQLHA